MRTATEAMRASLELGSVQRELYPLARRLGIKGYAALPKSALVDAIMEADPVGTAMAAMMADSASVPGAVTQGAAPFAGDAAAILADAIRQIAAGSVPVAPAAPELDTAAVEAIVDARVAGLTLPREVVVRVKRPGAKRGSSTCLPCHDGAPRSDPAPAPSDTAPGAPRWNEHVIRALATPMDLAPEIGQRDRDRETGTASQETFSDAVSRIEHGDTRPSVLAAVERGRAEGRRLGAPLAARVAMQLDFCGAVPSVPHYLAGCDRTMMRPASEPSESAPLRIYVASALSWIVEESDALERGGRIAGLVDALASVRSVELWCYVHTKSGQEGGGHVVLSWRVDTRDTPRMVPSFGQTAYRGIVLRWSYGMFAKEPSASNYRTMIPRDVATTREHLGCSPDDIVTPGFIRAGDDGDVQGIIRAIESRLPSES